MNKEKKPLYRKDNTKARGHDNRSTEHARYDRHTKDGLRKSMQPHKPYRVKLGRDYNPLYMFLLSKIGQNWDEVFSEAKSRLDVEDPIWYMVAEHEKDRTEHGTVRIGESTYFSQLYVDEEGILRVSRPEVTNETLYPSCSCCTHTFNGKKFTNKYVIWGMRQTETE